MSTTTLGLQDTHTTGEEVRNSKTNGNVARYATHMKSIHAWSGDVRHLGLGMAGSATRYPVLDLLADFEVVSQLWSKHRSRVCRCSSLGKSRGMLAWRARGKRSERSSHSLGSFPSCPAPPPQLYTVMLNSQTQHPTLACKIQSRRSRASSGHGSAGFSVQRKAS